MALVFTVSRHAVEGDRKFKEGTITFTGATSYTTGGVATVPADYGLSQLTGIEVLSFAGGELIPVGVPTPTNLIVTTAVPGRTEVAAAGNPTACSAFVRAIGV